MRTRNHGYHDPVSGPQPGTCAVCGSDNWSENSQAERIARVTTALRTFSLPAGSKDAVILADLPAGPYTIHLEGADGGVGNGMIEIYVLQGEVQLDGADIPEKHLVLLDAGARHRLRAKTPIKAMLFGGEPLDGRRHMWWNFVSSSKERIEQAKADWLAGRFGTVPGETEFIPLPER